MRRRRVVCIVEGHAEVVVVPLLIRRIAAAAGAISPEIPHPIRVTKSKLVRSGELERAVDLASRQCSDDDGIMILVDADDDCPAIIGSELLKRAGISRKDMKVSVVIAKREIEAWVLAGAGSIAGKRGMTQELENQSDAEEIRDPKGWLMAKSHQQYRPTVDLAALFSELRLDAARSAPSFDKFCREIETLLSVQT